MVFEPISVVGFVGTAAGVISFMANTVENLRKRGDDFAKCADRLQDYRDGIDVLYLQLDTWKRTWCTTTGIEYTTDTYEYLWGTSGVQKVREMLSSIRKDTDEILDIVYYRHANKAELPWKTLQHHQHKKPTEDEQADWSLLLDRHIKDNKISVEFHAPNSLYKFCFALYLSNDIRSRISSLSDKIKNLENYTKLQFWKLQDESTTKEVAQERIEELSKLHPAWDLFAGTFRDVFDAHSFAGCLWGFVLNQSALEEGLDRLINLRMDRYFVAEDSARGDQSQVHYFRIKYPLIFRNEQTLYAQVQHWNTPTGSLCSSTRAMLPRSLSTLHEDLWLAEEPSLSRDQLDEIKEYADAACKIASSAILLYGSKWTDNICSCKLRYVRRCVRAGRGVDDLTLWPFQNCPENGVCFHSATGVKRPTFFLLATLLSELAMARPLRVSINEADAEPGFVIHENLRDLGLPDRLSLAQLVGNLGYMIPESVTQYFGQNYLKAVKFAFGMSERLQHRELRVEDLTRCLENITKP